MIDIPDALIATRSKYNGETGRTFVAALPGLADRFLGEWGLRLDGESRLGPEQAEIARQLLGRG
ncbi:hypothetical protein ACWD6R_01410 [Streptomyces sp. NPDC005151]